MVTRTERLVYVGISMHTRRHPIRTQLHAES
jgi:hypothetical protein